MASGLVCRANRPNTWLYRPACKRAEKPCQLGAVYTWYKADISSSGRLGSRGVLSRRHATGEEVPISRMKEREFISAYDQEEDYSPDDNW